MSFIIALHVGDGRGEGELIMDGDREGWAGVIIGPEERKK